LIFGKVLEPDSSVREIINNRPIKRTYRKLRRERQESLTRYSEFRKTGKSLTPEQKQERRLYPMDV